MRRGHPSFIESQGRDRIVADTAGAVSCAHHSWRNAELFTVFHTVIPSMMIVVCYDVSTETAAGRKRLRRVAKVCEGVGQRVQKSVFECQVDLMQYEELERRLLREINQAEDNLRVYRLTDPANCRIKEFGKFRSTDFSGPLVV